MNNILILGSLPKSVEKNNFYESIIQICSPYAKKISSPIDTANFKGSDSERYDLAFKKVKTANLIIGELSEPSTGQGMELREAALLNKTILILAKEGSEISGIVKGCKQVKKILFYKSIDDLKLKLTAILQSIGD